MAKTKCSSCRKKWEAHDGVQGTCARLQTALETLRQIAGQPRNTLSRRLAKATLTFLERHP